jgi:hypothetical protein
MSCVRCRTYRAFATPTCGEGEKKKYCKLCHQMILSQSWDPPTDVVYETWHAPKIHVPPLVFDDRYYPGGSREPQVDVVRSRREIEAIYMSSQNRDKVIISDMNQWDRETMIKVYEKDGRLLKKYTVCL